MTYRSSRYASSSSPACNSAAARSRPSCWPSEKSAGVRAEKSQRDDQLIAFLRARSWEHKSAFAGHSQTFPRERRSISQNFVRASPKEGRTGLAPVREQRIPPLFGPLVCCHSDGGRGRGWVQSQLQHSQLPLAGRDSVSELSATRIGARGKHQCPAGPTVRENGPYPRVPFTDDPGVGACRGLWG